jgi:hypothetical protein
MAKGKRKWKAGQRLAPPTFPPDRPVFTGPLDFWYPPTTAKPALKTGAHFDGPTYQPAQDHTHLTGQLRRVYDAMAGGEWWTVPELEKALLPGGYVSQTGIAARIRDLRKPKFGGFSIEARRRAGDGTHLWEYRIVT